MLIRALFLYAIIGSAGTLVGCATIPEQEVQNYAIAFQQARLAGDLVFDKVSPIIAEDTPETDGGCAKTSEGYYSCFDPLSVLTAGRSDDPRSVLVRRAALQSISNYNSALLAIAEGRFTIAETAEVGELLESGQLLLGLTATPVPGLPSLASDATFAAVRGLVAEIQEARSAVSIRRAIVDGAPTIQALLSALAQETPHIYNIYLTNKKSDLFNAVASGSSEDERAAIESINAYHASLTAYVEVLNTTSEALDTLVAAATAAPSASSLRSIIDSANRIKSQSEAFWAAARAIPG